MTNSLALVLGALILIGIGVDVAIFGSEHMVFLGKKMFWLLDWIAFWH